MKVRQKELRGIKLRGKENTWFFAVFIISFLVFCFSIFCLDTSTKSYMFFFNVSSSIFSACLLYVIVEFLPKYKKEKQSLEVLNRAICSILEAYFKVNIFQHEKSIKHVSLDYISSIVNIKEAQENIKSFNLNYLQLKYSIETAHSRYNDFQNLLIIANQISPKHSLFWLDIIEKVRLMSEEYNNFIDNPDLELLSDLRKMKNFENTKNKTYLMCDSMQLRVLEFFESTEEWLKTE